MLCAGELAKPPRVFPDKPLSRTGSGGLAAIPRTGNGWVWVNFWAAWCAPCKEELPRLRSWEKKLKASGKSFDLVLISLDDDPRQLDEFLKKQPADGVKTTYWLKEGKEREEWLTAATMDTDPELPAHLLVDPEGKIRCFVQGAVEDGDYASLERIVGG